VRLPSTSVQKAARAYTRARELAERRGDARPLANGSLRLVAIDHNLNVIFFK
jgi:hypothetical protein